MSRFDDFDDDNYPRQAQCDFDTVLSRRIFLGGSVAFSALPLLAATSARAANAFDFTPIAANTADTVTLPEGFDWRVVVKWGDPLLKGGVTFDTETRGSAASQARAFGDNNDGMALFDVDGRTLLAVNNEYTNRKGIFGNRAGGRPKTDDDVIKGMNAHGVSIVEIQSGGSGWKVVQDSPLNRRITPTTPMQITGPAAGHPLLQTKADPAGKTCLGTWANCGSGQTPWGNYLTCEENFNGYFSTSDPDFEASAEFYRYGIGAREWGYGWGRVDERFDISKHPNEPNRMGYVVEIDPSDPHSTPKKLTALGRFKHENAELVQSKNGCVVVYMGDDERGEFLYRYVSHYPLGEGAVLEQGTLYAATFNDDGSGEWRALIPETAEMTRAEICIHTRQAASRVKATTMDRPEWVATHPHRAEVYVALTNNKNRGKKPNKGGDKTPVGGPNPRAKNRYGQILRWLPEDGDHGADRFTWDLFALAGNPDIYDDERAGSDNITTDNMFNSPDGLSFDSNGLLWIRTDGDHSDKGKFAGMGNNQMLVGNPETGEIRRFLVGPKECELSGLTWSPDRKTLFLGVQHPGQKGNSSFPLGAGQIPRSCVIAITRKDGKTIG